MAKLSLTDISSGYQSLSTYNANNDLIEAAVENTLSRDGTSPNTMEAQLDMNSQRLVNLPDAVANQEPVTLAQAAIIAGVDAPLTQETVGAVLYPATAAETAAGVTPTNYYYPPSNVLRYGTNSSPGTTDMTTAINNADAISASADYEIPSGTYLYDGANLANIGNAAISDNATINSTLTDGIVQNDAGISWLHHNPLEASTGTITTGNIPAAPQFEGEKQSHTNVLAYWYQDFGLEAVRAAAGSLGSVTWYYWSWLFHGAAGDGYEAKRHPWLGYYRGDDANVLDWQCYWLNQAGVTGVVLQPRETYSTLMDGWSSSSDVNHWMYQLVTNVKNFNQLTYAVWAYSGSNSTAAANKTEIEASFTEIVDMYTAYPNVSTITKNGKVYPVVYAFETSFWRGAYDSYSGSTNTIAMLKAQADKFVAAGWDGFALLGRNNSTQLVGLPDLEDYGVLVYDVDYTPQYNPALNGAVDPALDYEDWSIGSDTGNITEIHPKEWSIPCVATDLESHSAHPSTWTWAGSTPALFENMCRNVLRRMAQDGSPRILTIYNVSEWAEGGASLQPNMRDGKGYLNALRNALAGAPYVRDDIRDSELVTATNTILPEESGTTFYLNAAGGFTSTLPAPAMGLKYKFVVKTAPTTAYIITTTSGANILYGTLLDIVGEQVAITAQDTINFVASTSLVGDSVEVESDGTNWYVTAKSLANGGITVSVT